MNKVILSLAFLICSSAFAGGSEGEITTPLVSSGDAFFFSAGVHQNKPACSTSQLASWAVDLTKPHGKAMQALVLSAHAQKKRVHVQGKGNCDVWGDRESVSYAYIVD